MARAAKKTATAALLEQSGAKPYQDFAVEPAMLTKFAGIYRSASGNELTVAPAGARVTLGTELRAAREESDRRSDHGHTGDL